MSAVDEAFACLEIDDSVYPNYRFRLEDNTADGSSAAQASPLRRLDSLESIAVVLRHGANDAGSATGSAASSHPAAGVVWLVAQLARQGRQLRAGDIVITGGLTRASATVARSGRGAACDIEEVERLRLCCIFTYRVLAG